MTRFASSGVFAAAVIALAAATCLEPEAPPPRATLRIELAVTPGKPDAPTERLVLTAGPGAERVEGKAERIAADGEVLHRAAIDITRQRFDVLWLEVSQLCPADLPHDLRPAPGYGDRTLRVVAGSDQTAADLALRWSAPLRAEAERLLAAVGKLAKLTPSDADSTFRLLPKADR